MRLSKNDMINSIVNILTVNEIKGVYFEVSDCSLGNNNTLISEPMGYKGNLLDGMQIIFENGTYEVSQFMAGKKQNELHVYLKTKSLKLAINSVLKGNKKRTIIEKWN